MTEREVGPAFPKALGAVVFVAAVVGTGAVAYRIERANERWKIEMDPLTKYRIRYRDMRARYHQRLLDASDLGGFVFDLWDEIQRANPSEARIGNADALSPH
jgi:hypothetical protein